MRNMQVVEGTEHEGSKCTLKQLFFRKMRLAEVVYCAEICAWLPFVVGCQRRKGTRGVVGRCAVHGHVVLFHQAAPKLHRFYAPGIQPSDTVVSSTNVRNSCHVHCPLLLDEQIKIPSLLRRYS